MRPVPVLVVALSAAIVHAAPPSGAGQKPGPDAPSLAGVTWAREVAPFPVLGADSQPLDLPFLGGLDVPRPQFVDIDGDGDLDLFLQEYVNALWFFENTGSRAAPRYEWRSDRYQDLEIGEWYRFVDLNGDGLVDLLAERPVSHIRHYRNVGTKTTPQFTLAGDLLDGAGQAMFMDRQNIPAIADLDCDGRLDLLVGRVEGVVDRYEATAVNAATFGLVAARYEGIEIIGTIGGGGGFGMPSARHGANALALADFDADGDQDLFWGDFFEPSVLLIENVGRTCSTPSFQVDPIVLPYASDVRTSGYNTPSPIDLDGDGDLDFLMGVIGGAFNPVRTSESNFLFWERVAKNRFDLRTRRFLNGIDVGSDAIPAVGDIDADGDLDLLIGTRIDASTGKPAPLYLLRNGGSRTSPRYGPAEVLALGSAYNLAPALGDLDDDGDLDLIVGTWNQDVLVFRNLGTPREPRWVPDETATIRPPRISHSTPVLADLDSDGDLDLLLGQANGGITYYRNTGSRKTPRFTLVSDRLDDIRAGRRSTPAIADVDADGLADLVIGHEDAGVPVVFRNAGTRTSPRFVGADPLPIPLPPASAPVFADLDGDGVPDLLAGTTSGGVRFYRGRRPAAARVRTASFSHGGAEDRRSGGTSAEARRDREGRPTRETNASLRPPEAFVSRVGCPSLRPLAAGGLRPPVAPGPHLRPVQEAPSSCAS